MLETPLVQQEIKEIEQRSARFAELDALITAGFGDTPGDEIPEDALIAKPVVHRPKWDASVRSLVRRPQARDVDEQFLSIADNRLRWKSRQYPPHPHNWRSAGRVPGDGRPRLRCRICGRVKIEGGSKARHKQTLIASLIEEGGLSVRKIASEAGCSKSTVQRVKEYLRAGKL